MSMAWIRPEAIQMSNPSHKKIGLATHLSVAPECHQLLLAMTKLPMLVLAKPDLKKTMLRP